VQMKKPAKLPSGRHQKIVVDYTRIIIEKIHNLLIFKVKFRQITYRIIIVMLNRSIYPIQNIPVKTLTLPLVYDTISPDPLTAFLVPLLPKPLYDQLIVCTDHYTL